MGRQKEWPQRYYQPSEGDFGRRFSQDEQSFGQADHYDHSYGDAYRESRAQPQRSYAGLGPKSYKRSDDRIQEEIYEVLTWNSDVDATDIEVTVRDGEVTLTGKVPDRRMKRLAEELIDEVSGVKDVFNQLKIKSSLSARHWV